MMDDRLQLFPERRRKKVGISTSVASSDGDEKSNSRTTGVPGVRARRRTGRASVVSR
jgi:hypothetical protein